MGCAPYGCCQCSPGRCLSSAGCQPARRHCPPLCPATWWPHAAARSRSSPSTRSEPEAVGGCSPSPPWPARQRDGVRKGSRKTKAPQTSDICLVPSSTHISLQGEGQHLLPPPIREACNGAGQLLYHQMGQGGNTDIIINAGWEWCFSASIIISSGLGKWRN